MNPVKKVRNDRSGVILITVIMLILVLSVVAIGVMGLNVSRVKSAQAVVDQIKAEQLAIGQFYQYQQSETMTGSAIAPTSGSASIGLKNFSYTVTRTAGAGLNNTNQITVGITY